MKICSFDVDENLYWRELEIGDAVAGSAMDEVILALIELKAVDGCVAVTGDSSWTNCGLLWRTTGAPMAK